jgi:uncharacterized protein YggE
MRNTNNNGIRSVCRFVAIALVVIGWLWIVPRPAKAQAAAANNAICSSSSGCSTQAPSPAFLDAGVFLRSHR